MCSVLLVVHNGCHVQRRRAGRGGDGERSDGMYDVHGVAWSCCVEAKTDAVEVGQSTKKKKRVQRHHGTFGSASTCMHSSPDTYVRLGCERARGSHLHEGCQLLFFILGGVGGGEASLYPHSRDGRAHRRGVVGRGALVLKWLMLVRYFDEGGWGGGRGAGRWGYSFFEALWAVMAVLQ